MQQFPPNTALSVYYTTIAQKYNLTNEGIFYIDLWPFAPPQMILASPESADLVTKVSNYPLHELGVEYLALLVGENAMGATNGETWKRTHRLLAPAFKASNLKTLVGVMAGQVGGLFVSRLRECAADGRVFSMDDAAARLLLSISTEVILGGHIGEQDKARLFGDIGDIVAYATVITMTTSSNPVVKWIAWWRKVRAVKRIDAFFKGLVRARYAVVREGVAKRKDTAAGMSILDRTLIEGRENDWSDKNELDVASERLLIDNLKGLILGAYGTTTDTLCAVFIMLAAHPEVVQKVREEHNQVFGDMENTRQLLDDNPYKLNELHYTTAVIKETLRLFPIGFTPRKSPPRTSTLTYKDKSYPTANQMIIPCQHTIHYDPTLFPSPSKFDPERFIDPNVVPTGAWRPFERGPRACTGRDLAIDELRLVLLLTIRQFDFELPDLEPRTTPRAQFTDMDLRLGDLAFQENAFSAKPRGGSMMRVRLAQKSE
ncbi:cytochrome P450 [Aspergillus heterothallicus]